MLSLAYLTPIQARIWDLQRRGSNQSTIAKELEKSRQFVHKSLQQAEARITKAFLEVAKLNNISIQSGVDARNGVVFGFSERFQVEVAFTYSCQYGVQIWYKDNGACETCRIATDCRHAILALYDERGLPLPSDVSHLSPSQIADHLFNLLKQPIQNRREFP